MNLKDLLKDLCESEYIGSVGNALNVANSHLSRFCETELCGGNVIGKLGANGESNSAVMLDAHIDEIGMMVVNVTDDGFVRVSAAGGIDYRMLAGMRVKIHAKEEILGVFCSVPPHLLGKESKVPKLSELYIDTGLGDKARDIISIGDRVTFKQSFRPLLGNCVTGKSLDNRAGVAVLIRVAEILKEKNLNCDVYFLLSDREETTQCGAVTKAFKIEPDEAIVVDVTFGNAPDIPPDKCGVLGSGAMIGVSPALDLNMCDDLRRVADENGIPYQVEVIGRTTGTNADVIASVKGGIKCGLLSVPLRNMHTPVEVVDTGDIESAANIISQYILSK